MLSIDLKNAFTGAPADNFTVLLLRMIAKADGDNRMLLARGFPECVDAVWEYQNDCPYTDTGSQVVNWVEIARRVGRE